MGDDGLQLRRKSSNFLAYRSLIQCALLEGALNRVISASPTALMTIEVVVKACCEKCCRGKAANRSTSKSSKKKRWLHLISGWPDTTSKRQSQPYCLPAAGACDVPWPPGMNEKALNKLSSAKPSRTRSRHVMHACQSGQRPHGNRLKCARRSITRRSKAVTVNMQWI